MFVPIQSLVVPGAQECHQAGKMCKEERATSGVGVAGFEGCFDWLLFIESFWQDRPWTMWSFPPNTGFEAGRWLRSGRAPQTRTIFNALQLVSHDAAIDDRQNGPGL